MVARRGASEPGNSNCSHDSRREPLRVTCCGRLETGCPARVKDLWYFARSNEPTKCRTVVVERLPGKDCPRAFYKPHLELEAARVRAIDQPGHEEDILAKVERLFGIMSRQLSEREISQGNVYNMDETGVLLSDLSIVKVLMSRSNVQSRGGGGLRRTMITAVDCVFADRRFLGPVILWPGKTLRTTTISHDTPD